jgi:hypothetical protein
VLLSLFSSSSSSSSSAPLFCRVHVRSLALIIQRLFWTIAAQCNTLECAYSSSRLLLVSFVIRYRFLRATSSLRGEGSRIYDILYAG